MAGTGMAVGGAAPMNGFGAAINRNPLATGWNGPGPNQTAPVTPVNPTPQQTAGGASYTNPQQASLPQNTAINLPTLPMPQNLVQTGGSLSPNGYTSNYGEDAGAVANRNAGIETDARNQAAALQKQQDENRAALAEKNRASALASFQQTIGGPGMAVNQPTEAELQEAARNQYGLAKDRVGQREGAALRQFQEVMSGRGLGGSTIEGEGAGHIFEGANDELGAVDVGQAIDAISRKRQVADQATAINEARRNQQMSMLSSIFSSNGSLY